MLVLPVGLSVITDDPVCECGWSSLGVGCGDFSVQCVVETLEETVAEVHVANWIDSFRELNATGDLSVSVGPFVLDTLHVPLVDNDDDFFIRALVDGGEEILITLVNEDLLEAWEEDGNVLDVPVDEVRVCALLCELVGLRQLLTLNQLLSFHLIMDVS